MSERKSLTARELIIELGKLDPETVVKTYESDSDWGHWFHYGVSGVHDNGILQYSMILESGSMWDDYDEEDEDEPSGA